MKHPSSKQVFIVLIVLALCSIAIHYSQRRHFSTRSGDRVSVRRHKTGPLLKQEEAVRMKGVARKSSDSALPRKDRVESPTNATGQTNDTARYVSFANSAYGGRRLGNQLFDFAAIIFVAELTGRTPVLRNKSRLSMERVFQLNLERIDDLCPCTSIKENFSWAYENSVEVQVFAAPWVHSKTVMVDGYRQSWKYTLAVEKRIRQHLVLSETLKAFSDGFLRDNTPVGWRKAGFVRVGIHARRGDILTQRHVIGGYTVASKTYFLKAMRYFIDRYSRVQFIVASNDYKWTTEHLANPGKFSDKVVNVTFSYKHSPGQDLAILSACDHVIMSTGTYSWWAAWLAKGTTIYYKNWPRKGSRLEGRGIRNDFFPPNWIGMGD